MNMTANRNRSKRLHKPAAFRPWHQTWAVIFSLVLAMFLPLPVFSASMGDFLGFFTGSSFYCSEDIIGGSWSFFVPSIPVGTLYDNGIADCSSLGITHLFSGFVCQFEHLVSDIFGQLYCGIQHYMQLPLSAFLTLFVTFIGVGFLTSYLQFTAKQVVLILFKIALVWAFATQSDFMISYLFNGFISFMQVSVYLVLKSLMSSTDMLDSSSIFFTDTLSPDGGLFGAMDKIINDLVSNSISAQMVTAQDPNFPGDPTKTIQVPSFTGGSCQNDPIKILIAIALSMPPLFMILGMTVIKLGMVLLRTLLGYLLCITGVMFLLTLAPIFMSLGMFQVTKGFFMSWLQLITGFAVQVFIMFAFLAIALSLLTKSQFGNYNHLVMNWSETYMQDSIKYGNLQPADPDKGFFCTLCDIDGASLDIGLSSEVKCKEPVEAVPPTALYSSKGIVELLSIKIFALALIAYLFEAILNLAPSVAQSLSQGIGVMGGSSSTPSISTGGVSPVPGKGHVQAGKAMMRQTTNVGSTGSLTTEALKGMLGIR